MKMKRETDKHSREDFEKDLELFLMYYKELREAQKKHFLHRDKHTLGIAKLREKALDDRAQFLKEKYFTKNLFS